MVSYTSERFIVDIVCVYEVKSWCNVEYVVKSVSFMCWF